MKTVTYAAPVNRKQQPLITPAFDEDYHPAGGGEATCQGKIRQMTPAFPRSTHLATALRHGTMARHISQILSPLPAAAFASATLPCLITYHYVTIIIIIGGYYDD